MASQPPEASAPRRIAAVLLAAGEGRRMGQTKALVEAEGTTFLGRCVGLLDRPGVAPCIVVTGFDAPRVERAAPAGVILVRNPAPDEGMLSSLLVGLAEAERQGAEAVIAHLVDHPFVAPTTVDRVVAALAAGAAIVVPSHGGRRGHPVGFAGRTWGALRAAPPSRGARAVLETHPDWVVHVQGDPGCLMDIDTPADLAGWHASRGDG